MAVWTINMPLLNNILVLIFAGLNNAIQPLYIAGQVFSHSSEHEALVSLIKQIEKVTGWAMTWRVHDLNSYWGYAENTFLRSTKA